MAYNNIKKRLANMRKGGKESDEGVLYLVRVKILNVDKLKSLKSSDKDEYCISWKRAGKVDTPYYGTTGYHQVVKGKLEILEGFEVTFRRRKIEKKKIVHVTLSKKNAKSGENEDVAFGDLDLSKVVPHIQDHFASFETTCDLDMKKNKVKVVLKLSLNSTVDINAKARKYTEMFSKMRYVHDDFIKSLQRFTQHHDGILKKKDFVYEKTKKTNDKSIGSLKKSYEDKLERMRKDHAKELDKLKSEKQQELDQVRKTLEEKRKNEIAALKESNRKEKQSLITQLQDKMTKIDKLNKDITIGKKQKEALLAIGSSGPGVKKAEIVKKVVAAQISKEAREEKGEDKIEALKPVKGSQDFESLVLLQFVAKNHKKLFSDSPYLYDLDIVMKKKGSTKPHLILWNGEKRMSSFNIIDVVFLDSSNDKEVEEMKKGFVKIRTRLSDVGRRYLKKNGMKLMHKVVGKICTNTDLGDLETEYNDFRKTFD